MEAIYKKLFYPSEARNNEVVGTVKIQAFVDEYGEVIEADVLEGIGSGCDDVARNAIYFAKFKPGLQKGKPIRATSIISIKFNPEMNQN
jgi:TonB family protein